MPDVYILGAHSTPFGKRPADTFRDLTRETYLGVLADAGLETGDPGRWPQILRVRAPWRQTAAPLANSDLGCRGHPGIPI